MSQGPASTYARMVVEMRAFLRKHQIGNDPTVAAYMAMRIAALEIRAARGHKHAGELAYKLGDELTTSGPEAVG